MAPSLDLFEWEPYMEADRQIYEQMVRLAGNIRWEPVTHRAPWSFSNLIAFCQSQDIAVLFRADGPGFVPVKLQAPARVGSTPPE